MKSQRKPEQQHWLTRSATIRKLWWLFSAVLLVTIVAQFVIAVKQHFIVDGWFGFYALFGFASCIAMVVLAKILGVIVKRNERYYEDKSPDV
jgi:hypothetical protein